MKHSSARAASQVHRTVKNVAAAKGEHRRSRRSGAGDGGTSHRRSRRGQRARANFAGNFSRYLDRLAPPLVQQPLSFRGVSVDDASAARHDGTLVAVVAHNVHNLRVH